MHRKGSGLGESRTGMWWSWDRTGKWPGLGESGAVCGGTEMAPRCTLPPQGRGQAFYYGTVGGTYHLVGSSEQGLVLGLVRSWQGPVKVGAGLASRAGTWSASETSGSAAHAACPRQAHFVCPIATAAAGLQSACKSCHWDAVLLRLGWES